MNSLFRISVLLTTLTSFAQDQSQSPWHIVASDIDPNNYYGITLANGMVGMVSSPDPLKVDEVILNGVYDYYQRGRVSNILKAFNHIDLDLSLDEIYVERRSIQNYQQVIVGIVDRTKIDKQVRR